MIKARKFSKCIALSGTSMVAASLLAAELWRVIAS